MLGGDTGAPATRRAAQTHLGKYHSCSRRMRSCRMIKFLIVLYCQSNGQELVQYIYFGGINIQLFLDCYAQFRG